ncbi:DJ-1/PfpI family protein [Burkholderia sp. Ac-20379]|uniref:DJ-1/PfpI family protein n=1 Tax=Burkholderia sp. Ac-20379 TaxID=2703900 RepID=UPI00198067F7|nr:DJ-1/PfpI family protein [Burkholderia sp. Ac-20379]MBN3727744.1 DJ-1/PfpI family protein [Burkholderia sp. Ac-20379]
MTQALELAPPTHVAGLLLFPDMTQLDLTGPLEVLGRLPGWRAEVVAPSRAPVRTDKGLVIQPDADFASASAYDLFVVPGGPGTDEAMLDPRIVGFVRERALAAKHVFGICTGSLLLGAAGLLKGRRAGSHWQARHLLSQFGATPSDARLTIDGKLYTSGGVTAGIDMALQVAAEVAGEDVARQIQLQIEYDPAPPFRAGTPFVAPAGIVERAMASTAARRAIREAAVAKAAARLAAAG